MRRRGNKSNKVPGVKLRPAEKGAFSRSVEESCWAQDTQAGSDDTTLLDLCPRPFKGVVICATGVPDKPTIFKQAVELGATCTPAFTDRVTHLVATGHGGAKYMCALERKIPILKPSWVTENYQVWLRGDDVDTVKSVEQHRLPIFSGVILCPSGISDITRRTQINKLLVANEGTYLKNLERPVKVTHLLCSGDEETDKMCYAEKFNSRGEAKIHLVWEEWFWDSLDFGGRFDEAKYQVRRPRPERKTVGEVTSSPPPPSSEVPSQHDEPPSSSAPKSKQPPQPPQNSTLDEMEEEKAFANVLPDATLLLWSKLLERRGYQVTDGEVILSPSKAHGPLSNAKKLDMPNRPSSPQRHAGGSLISSFRRANSFAPVAQAKDPGTSRQMPFRRSSSSVAGAIAVASSSKAATRPPLEEQLGRMQTSETIREAEAGPSGSVPAASVPASMMFAGMVFRALGEARSPNVRRAIEELGGRMSTDQDEDVNFVIVRLVSGSKLYREEDDPLLRAKYRTECWLEQCIYEDRICAAEDHVSFIPLAVDIPIPGAEKIIMSLSGFDQSEACGLKRLLRALGINLAPTFSRRATHLLCPSGTGLKFEKACQWGIPVVNLPWLAKMVENGQIPGLDGFLVSAPVCGDAHAPEAPIAADSMTIDEERMKDKKDLKGKGMAIDKGKGRQGISCEMSIVVNVDVGDRMNDITNNTSSEDQPQPCAFEKPRLLERQPTTIIPQLDPPETTSFGVAQGPLGRSSSFIPHPSSLCTPARSVASPVLQFPNHNESFTARSTSNVESFNANDLNLDLGSLSRRPSQRSADVISQAAGEGDSRIRVPSSKSPSPMKSLQNIHANGSSSSRLSLSPVKIDHEATKALQESITSLLGKRPSPEGDDLAGGAAGGADIPRNGKRARPHRSKPQTRQGSDVNVIGGPAAVPGVTTRSRAPPAIILRPGAVTGDPFESYNAVDEFEHESVKSQEESMRVMYEDPGQRDEKKRLISLLKNQGGVEEDSLGSSGGFEKRARRSMRIAGF
ncbi:hypothetical protein BYT27DRAFT_7131662 [Phlegmacium glaucopus]|nr:hypothetical protein BYT27DRAFT_7131662 [Phlegmacium glaucopus]